MSFSRFILLCLIGGTFADLSQTPLSVPSRNFLPDHENARVNAPQIFNAVHSAMRQWGSSLNHNGMSFFRASIPKNTDFYHGRGSAEPITSGMEWLAFEIEHAEHFARNRGPEGPSSPGKKPPIESQTSSITQGALHQYRTNRELHALFLDGMSAGKTELGTLDQQDYILCNETRGFNTYPLVDTKAEGFHPPGDSKRAIQMCEEFPIDAVVRMEAGFELILCDFAVGVDFVSATPRPMAGTKEAHNSLFGFEYLRGVSHRYHGITASRVKVDFSNMVSAFWHTINLTNPDPKHASLPRLVSAEPETLAKIKTEVVSMLTMKNQSPTIDWQGVVDLITTRYSDRLQFMALSSTSHNLLVSEINFLLSLFIDYSIETPDVSLAISRCTFHYLSSLPLSTAQDHLLYTSVSTVTKRICSTLFDVRSLVFIDDSRSTTEEAKDKIDGLTKYLGWTTWLECGKCKFDEICFVAIWPFGGVKEHESPECANSDEVEKRRGYWGEHGPGGRKPKPGDMDVRPEPSYI